MIEPNGCLACNHDPVHAFLVARGIDPARFVQVPTPRHNWPGMTDCAVCGTCFLITQGAFKTKEIEAEARSIVDDVAAALWALPSPLAARLDCLRDILWPKETP